MGPRTEVALSAVTELLVSLYDEGSVGVEIIEGPVDHDAYLQHVGARMLEVLRSHDAGDPALSDALFSEAGKHVAQAILLDRREATGGHLRVV